MTKLILVDDEQLILDSVSKYISNFLPEFEICGRFYAGEDALQYLLENPVDIVVTDICMPNMDGLELAREISNRLPHCVTIIVSGYNEFEYARTAIKYNVLNYLLKPLDFKELQKCLLEAETISHTRTAAQLPKTDLSEEAIEVFFVDLLIGLISSETELQQKFSALNLPFALSNSEGTLIKISLTKDNISSEWYYGIDQLEISLRNMLRLTIQDTPVYFVRRSDLDFYYIIFKHDMTANLIFDQLVNTANELLNLQCSISQYQHFDTLKEFVQNKPHRTIVQGHTKTSTDDTVIQKAIDYIELNYAKELTREMVADIVFLSPSYFSYQFKNKTGISFFDYLTNVRMQKAIELLNTKMKVNDIALKVGYQSKNRFFINFRQYTTYTPTEYRKKMLCVGDTSSES